MVKNFVVFIFFTPSFEGGCAVEKSLKLARLAVLVNRHGGTLVAQQHLWIERWNSPRFFAKAKFKIKTIEDLDVYLRPIDQPPPPPEVCNGLGGVVKLSNAPLSVHLMTQVAQLHIADDGVHVTSSVDVSAVDAEVFVVEVETVAKQQQLEEDLDLVQFCCSCSLSVGDEENRDQNNELVFFPKVDATNIFFGHSTATNN